MNLRIEFKTTCFVEPSVSFKERNTFLPHFVFYPLIIQKSTFNKAHVMLEWWQYQLHFSRVCKLDPYFSINTLLIKLKNLVLYKYIFFYFFNTETAAIEYNQYSA